MLVFQLLNSKNRFVKDNGDIVIDLTRISTNEDQLGRINPISLFTVNDRQVMRADLISQDFYRDSNSADLLMKYNAISNPFAIDEGDVIRVPAKGELSKLISKPIDIKDIGDVEERSVSEKLLNPNSAKDKKRLEELRKSGKSREIVPSNFIKKGDKNVKVKDGKIVFGEDVTTINKDNCPEPLSRARLKKSLIKNNLFG